MVEKLEIRLLGGIILLKNGKPIKGFPTRAVQALFVYLLHQEIPIERERLVDLFFQASTPKQASANLRAALSNMRKELSNFLEINNRSVQVVNKEAIWIDSVALETAVSTPNNYNEILSLYQGEFLAGFYLREAPEFEQWMVVERERLQLIAIESFTKAVSHFEAQADYFSALKICNQLLSVEPLLEEIHQLKMMFLARTGQKLPAINHYHDTVALFEEELATAVSAETTAVYERISSLKIPPPHNLPSANDAFIGRSEEVSSLLRLLTQPERRLITLFGIGGVGKTRLAVEVSHALLAQKPGHFLDGVYFVSLVGLKTAVSANELALQILQTLGLAPFGNQPPTEQLIAAIREKEMLLVLDNFEHILAHNSAFMAELLEKVSHLKLMITSRERLNLREETVFDLSGLPFEAIDTLANDSAKLFVSHAQQHKFSFAPSDEDVPAIGKICHLLEGVPLGIELAAGSVRDRSCRVIFEQIEHNLGVLNSHFENMPERQRSLRAAFLHSWHLLDEALQPIFASLTVFPNTFNADAAQVIVGVKARQLDTFVDKALLKVENGRFSMHPLIKEFALEQLELEKSKTLRDKHSHYFAQFIAERSVAAHRPTYIKALPSLTQAYDDLVPAWQWAIEQLVADESEQCWAWIKAMRRPLIRFFFQKSWFYASRELFRNSRLALETAGWHLEETKSPRRLLHAQLIVADYNATRIMGDVVAALEPTQQVVDVLKENLALDELFDAYSVLVGCHLQLRQFDEVPDLLDEMEGLALELQKPHQFGVYYVVKSYYVDFMGDTEAALHFARQGLNSFKEIEDTYYQAITLDGIARRLKNLGRMDEALAALGEAAVYAEANGQLLTQAFIQRGMGEYYVIVEKYEEAISAYEKGRQLFTEVNDLRYVIDIDYGLALVALAQNRLRDAIRFLIPTLQRAQKYTIPRHIKNIKALLSFFHWHRGDKARAMTLYFAFQELEELTPEEFNLSSRTKKLMDEAGVSKAAEQKAQANRVDIDFDRELAIFVREGLSWFAGEAVR